MPFAIGGNQLDTGYEVSNSLRFNDDDSAYLNRTFPTPTNGKKFTFSAWYKRSTLSTTQYIISHDSGGTPMAIIGFSSTDKFIIFDRDASSGAADIDYNTTQLFRDVSAWYNIVVSIDTTDGTSGDRVKIYVNGTRITSFDTSTAPAQNYDTIMNSAVSHDIGRWQAGSSFYDGYMSEINFIDGQALDSSYFGETNQNGVWIPKEYDGTYGNSGFFLEFKQTGTSANSSGMGADTSGNDNHFSAINLAAIDVTTDTPTNNFNTLNPLANQMGGTLSQGNTQCVGAAASDKHVFGTFGLTQGKWYWEVKVTDQGARGSVFISDSDHNDVIGTNYAGHSFWSGGSSTSATANSNVGSGASDNDIICFAADLDNGQLFMSKNADIDTSGTANITGLATSGLDRDYRISQRETGNPASTMQHNYGNAPFSISSSNSDSEGHGSFEFAVPSGYFALCTKNLAEYG